MRKIALLFLVLFISGCGEKYDAEADLACAKYFLASAKESNQGNNKYLAVPFCMQAAEAGSARAQFSLGFFYLHGVGLEKNEDQAIFWLRKSADQGLREAINALQNLSKEVAPERYLCTTDNGAYFTQNPDKNDCRDAKLADGWKNLYFSKEYLLDYYQKGLVRTENEVKVWSQMLFNSPQINKTQSNIRFDELKSLLIFNCTAREYKNPNIVYLFEDKELLRTTGNRTDGAGIIHFDDIIQQVEPGTFVDALFKEMCSTNDAP